MNPTLGNRRDRSVTFKAVIYSATMDRATREESDLKREERAERVFRP